MLWGSTGSRTVVRARFFRRSNSSSSSVRVLPPFITTTARSSLLSVSKLSRSRGLKSSARVLVVKPFLLADIGEGIRECEVIQWFVQPEARGFFYFPSCGFLTCLPFSDKCGGLLLVPVGLLAGWLDSITSRYDGVIKKLHYEAGDMAIVGKPLVDIDLQADINDPELGEMQSKTPAVSAVSKQAPKISEGMNGPGQFSTTRPHGSLATPAVRRMTREHDVEITEITGTGKDGRVLKEDVTRFVEARKSGELSQLSSQLSAPRPPLARAVTLGVETKVPLTHIQSQMLRSMTKSLTIPHFLYSDEINFDPLIRLRSIINKPLDANPPVPRVSFTPFVVKAVSIALDQYPLLNSRLEFDGDNKPYLIMRPQHNIGVAMDTPVGLVVPNIKDVNSLSILDIAAELKRLQELGGEGKLTPADLSGGTITVSNIGNIGGTVVAPVIVAGEVAILGMGRARKLPRFNENGGVVAETVANFSWSADHRVVDGATMARMAALVRELLEVPAKMFARMR
ncbi:unnamed protein product [Tuber melanosporum]|uniref:dihydrolipoyllysine-residue (2-methylpropanoyl)transferase n=1 Tax=Tuber melanosporum (strain Mel28) TaxID=656061 RepID=D5G9E0_TUBMM|nr:uncharacterized protein GSTUM_00003265001 [Tuber melanosporum]CAZ81133.1 unnamed protein product [Tuber melanosporum]